MTNVPDHDEGSRDSTLALVVFHLWIKGGRRPVNPNQSLGVIQLNNCASTNRIVVFVKPPVTYGDGSNIAEGGINVDLQHVHLVNAAQTLQQSFPLVSGESCPLVQHNPPG